jgi:FkbM family methyltransferase
MGVKKKLLKMFPIHYFRKNIYYSQEGEDIILKDLFYSKGLHKGFYVDVGAHHPIRFSNTHLLYKKGWSGLNFEPNISSKTAFKFFRKRDKTIHIGIGLTEEEKDFYVFDEPAINSFDESLSLDRDANTRYKLIKKVKIPILKLETALDKYLPKHQKINLMTIDVEGLDMEVLQSNNWEKYKPEVVLIEDMDFDFDKPETSQVYAFLKDKGYTLYAKTKRTLILNLT